MTRPNSALFSAPRFSLPPISLGFFPTPLTPLEKLGRLAGGSELFIKRDDLSGLALGGNKTRKLEFILAQALAEGADTLITAGAAQSNHCRQTAAAAARLQLECHLVLGGSEPAACNGNLLLDRIFGCHIHWAGNHRKGEDIPQIAEQLKQAGRKPFVVPYGGSNELGALGFVNAMYELDKQMKALSTEFSHIVFASSSGGTQAGLMLGRKMLGASCQLIGINIDKDETAEQSFAQQIISLAQSTAEFIGLDFSFSHQDLLLDSNYIGEGYGVIGEREREAIQLVARGEGILLDPVYTGRAMAGLLDMIRQGRLSKSDRVLFWHTGGAPALFAYADEL